MDNVANILINSYGALKNPSRLLSPFRYMLRNVANILVPVYYKRHPVKHLYRSDSNIVISLTSFPARIDRVWIVIESLFRQTLLPNKIILWLAKTQFRDISELPLSLTTRINDLFEIRFVDEDLKSHKKYYYTFREFKECITVIVDDDIIYPCNMIEELINTMKENPNSILCRFGLQMKFDAEGELKPYSQWAEYYEPYSKDFFFGSGGGTLFPTKEMPEETVDKDLFFSLTPTADDVWLNAMARVAKLKILIITNSLFLPIINKNKFRLTNINVGENQNDVQLKNVIDYYKVKGVDLFKKEDDVSQ